MLSGRAGCVSADGSDGQCSQGRALDGVSAVAVSRDSKSVYATASSANAVVAFARGANGALRELPGAAGCVSDGGNGGTCTSGRSLLGPQALVVSPDGRNIYANTVQASGGLVTYDALDTFRRQLPPPAPLPKCKKVRRARSSTPAASSAPCPDSKARALRPRVRARSVLRPSANGVRPSAVAAIFTVTLNASDQAGKPSPTPAFTGPSRRRVHPANRITTSARARPVQSASAMERHSPQSR